AVREIGAGEISALEDRPADGPAEIGTDVDVVEIEIGLIRAFSAPVECIVVREAGGKEVRGADVCCDTLFEKFGAESLIVLVEFGGVHAYGEESFAGVAYRPVLGVHDLPVDDDGADDEC